MQWTGGAVFGAVLLIANTAMAQSECDGILRSGLFNTSTVINRDSAAAASKADMCAMSYQEARRSGAFSAGGSYGLFGAEASTSEQKYNVAKQQHCSSFSNNDERDVFRYETQRAVAGEVVASWRACMMQRRGLNCIVSPDNDPTHSMITVIWNELSRNLPRIRSLTIINGTNVTDENNSTKLFATGATLPTGQTSLTIRRNQDSQAVRGSLNILHEDFNSHQCSFYIPVAMRPPPPPVLEPITAAEAAALQVTQCNCLKFSVDPPLPNIDFIGPPPPVPAGTKILMRNTCPRDVTVVLEKATYPVPRLGFPLTETTKIYSRAKIASRQVLTTPVEGTVRFTARADCGGETDTTGTSSFEP